MKTKHTNLSEKEANTIKLALELGTSIILESGFFLHHKEEIKNMLKKGYFVMDVMEMPLSWDEEIIKQRAT